MNVWMDSGDQIGTPNPERYRVFTKLSDFSGEAPPSGIFVFIDEREDSIGDSHFHIDVQERGKAAKFWAWPGSYHNGGGNLSFADGHAEPKKWKDPRTMPPMKKRTNIYGPVSSSNNPDLAWIQDRSTALK